MKIILHPQEDRKKCTISGLRENPALAFLPAGTKAIPEDGFLLHPDGEPLISSDAGCELILVDATWKYFGRMMNRYPDLEKLEKRRSDGFETVYPRKGRNGPHPPNYLASIEVIISAGLILGRKEYMDVLDEYHFREAFLERNRETINVLRNGDQERAIK